MGKAENVELGKKALLALVVGLLSLNLLTFLTAYPQIANLDSGCCSNHPLAKDFSGVYIGARRLFHNPAAVYGHGNARWRTADLPSTGAVQVSLVLSLLSLTCSATELSEFYPSLRHIPIPTAATGRASRVSTYEGKKVGR